VGEGAETGSGGGLRLFVALDLPAGHRREICCRADRLAGELPPARWVRADAMHLTLAFLGDTLPEQVAGLAEALTPAFAAVPALDLELAGGGTFPPHRPARVAWVGITGPAELAALQRRVAGAAGAFLGRPPERKPFHAHVTVARPRRPWDRRATERFAAAFEGRVGEPFTVGDGVLYRSELSPGGSIYTALERFPLGGEEGR